MDSPPFNSTALTVSPAAAENIFVGGCAYSYFEDILFYLHIVNHLKGNLETCCRSAVIDFHLMLKGREGPVRHVHSDRPSLLIVTAHRLTRNRDCGRHGPVFVLLRYILTGLHNPWSRHGLAERFDLDPAMAKHKRISLPQKQRSY